MTGPPNTSAWVVIWSGVGNIEAPDTRHNQVRISDSETQYDCNESESTEHWTHSNPLIEI